MARVKVGSWVTVRTRVSISREGVRTINEFNIRPGKTKMQVTALNRGIAHVHLPEHYLEVGVFRKEDLTVTDPPEE